MLKLDLYWRVPKYRVPIVLFFVFVLGGLFLLLLGGGIRQPRILLLSILGVVSYVIAFVLLLVFVIIPSKNRYPFVTDKEPER